MSNGAPGLYPAEMLTNQSITPNTVITQNTGLCRYYRRYLLQKVISVFKFDLPEEWDRDYFLYVLYGLGYIGIVDTFEFGVIPQRCGLMGYNVFERPRKAIFTNPLYNTLEKTIGVDCVVVKLTPDYWGVMDLVNQYAELMALTLSGISVNILNSRLAYVFYADSKAAAESYKDLFDKVTSGEPAVVLNTKALPKGGNLKPWEPFSQNLKNTYIAPEMLESLRSIENQFATDVGLPNTNYNKKERMNVDEVNANNAETGTRCELWLDSIQKGFEQANKMFGLNLKVGWRINPMEGGAAGESEANNDRSL